METNKTFGLGVFVCIFNRDFSKIMLLKRNEEKRKKWGADWGNVGGKIEFGETSEEACLREAKEEIGLNLNKSDLKLLFVKETPNFLEEVHALHFVYAITLNETESIKINVESDEFQWFEIENLPNKMIDKKEEILNILNLTKRQFENE